MAVFNWQSPFKVINLTMLWGHFMTILSHGAGNAIRKSGGDFADRPLSMLLLD